MVFPKASSGSMTFLCNLKVKAAFGSATDVVHTDTNVNIHNVRDSLPFMNIVLALARMTEGPT